MYYTLFTFDFAMDGLKPKIGIDCFHCQKFPDNMNDTTFQVARQIDNSYGDDFVSVLSGMQLRTRFANSPQGFDGVYVVKGEIELDRETLQMVIDAKQESGELLEFIKNSQLEL